jgi:hypothetical protein
MKKSVAEVLMQLGYEKKEKINYFQKASSCRGCSRRLELVVLARAAVVLVLARDAL